MSKTALVHAKASHIAVTRRSRLSIVPAGVSTKHRATKSRKITDKEFYEHLNSMSLKAMDSLQAHLEDNLGANAPIHRAMARLPKDILERIYELSDRLEDAALGEDGFEEIDLRAFRLIQALRPFGVVSKLYREKWERERRESENSREEEVVSA